MPEAALRRRGITRREFIKWTGIMAATLALPALFNVRIARAAELVTRLPISYQELQTCTGNAKALIKNTNPDIDGLILELLSLEYIPVLMAAAGYQAKEVLDSAIERFRGQYLAIFEGPVPVGMDGQYLTSGPDGVTGLAITRRIAQDALVVISTGTCASYGGIPMARPNPTSALVVYA